jgi:CheY-like chemotaxis protein
MTSDPRIPNRLAETERLRAELERERALRAALEEELRQAQRLEALGKAAGTAAHDFNNLVTVIAAHTDALAEIIPGGDPRRVHVDGIREAVGRAAAAVRRLQSARAAAAAAAGDAVGAPSPVGAGAPMSAPSGAPARGTETVLLVDNEAPVRALMREILRMHGYVVLEAASGEEALEQSARHPGPIDLVVADVVMPGLSGRELVERLADGRPRIRALYVSGHGEDVARQHGLVPAAGNYLGKPFTVDALAHKVRAVLDAVSG